MPIYLSASSISDFIKCPQKVLYRLKKTVKEIPSKSMTVGKIAHLAIEKGWRDRDIAYRIVDDESEKNNLKTADNTNLKFLLDVFFLNFQSRLKDSDLIEYNFKLPLYDDVFIVGKMDRISAGNLYDWKTGKVPTKLYNDVQCIVYNWAFPKLFGHEASSICIAALQTGELLPYKEDSFYRDEIFNNIIPRMIKTVRHDGYERLGLFNHSCFMCPWRLGCLGGGTEYELDSPIFTE